MLLLLLNRPNYTLSGLSPKPRPDATIWMFPDCIRGWDFTPPEGLQGSQPAHPLLVLPQMGGRRLALLCRALRDGDLPSKALCGDVSVVEQAACLTRIFTLASLHFPAKCGVSRLFRILLRLY